MTREKMKKVFANASCLANGSVGKMLECDTHHKTCLQLANYLIDIKDFD